MYPSGHMIWMAIGWLFAMAVGAGMVWTLLVVLSTWTKGPSPSTLSPEESLRRRLADGEIDIEQYEKRLEALSKHKEAA